MRIDKLRAKQGAGSLFGAEEETIPESFLGEDTESVDDSETDGEDE